jgi:hypothetical protein
MKVYCNQSLRRILSENGIELPSEQEFHLLTSLDSGKAIYGLFLHDQLKEAELFYENALVRGQIVVSPKYDLDQKVLWLSETPTLF